MRRSTMPSKDGKEEDNFDQPLHVFQTRVVRTDVGQVNRELFLIRSLARSI